jgi:hypothetical protein
MAFNLNRRRAISAPESASLLLESVGPPPSQLQRNPCWRADPQTQHFSALEAGFVDLALFSAPRASALNEEANTSSFAVLPESLATATMSVSLAISARMVLTCTRSYW